MKTKQNRKKAKQKTFELELNEKDFIKVKIIFMESLILAQDERWRRA